MTRSAAMPLPPGTPDLAALDLLLSVARLGSVGRAAAEHGVSQPTASTRLARLERRLGVPLLVRTAQGSTLTPGGEAVVAWAHEVVDAAHRLADGVASLREDRAARLRVAASLTVAEYLLPAWLLALRARRPDLDVSAQVANSREVCALVRTGAVDLGFVEMADVPADMSHTDVGADRLTLVVAASYPLAARATVAPRDLLDAPLLLREKGSGTRGVFLRALADALGSPTVEPPHATALGSTATILATVRAGGGIGVVSARAVAVDVAAGVLVELDCPGLDLRRQLRAVWQGRRPSGLAADLIGVAGQTRSIASAIESSTRPGR